MRLTGSISIVIIAFLTIASSVEAQFMNRLKQRAQDRVEQKVEQKIENQLDKTADRMVDNAWDSIFGEPAAGSSERSSRSFPFSLNSNVTTEDSYHFDTITTMEIVTEKKGKKEPPVIMQMHFNGSEMYTGTRISGEDIAEGDGDVFLIYDLKNSAMIMLMNSEDGKFSFAYDWTQAQSLLDEMEESDKYTEDDAYENEDHEWAGFEKIGQKKILGYNCDGYRSESDNTVTEIWVNREASHGMETMFQANSNTKQMKGRIPEDYPYGMMMKTIATDQDSGETMTMTVTEIRENARVVYRMSDYPTMGL